jgi:hypothetical protein
LGMQRTPGRVRRIVNVVWEGSESL